MDEPTAVLTDRETEILFDTVRELKKRGVAVIYISHRLAEIKQICDRYPKCNRCPLDKRCDREFGMEGKVNG